MKRPPSGRKAFHAMGQSDKARKIPGAVSIIRKWPKWAQKAYLAGWHGFAP